MRLQVYDVIEPLKPYIKLICTMDCDGDMDTHYLRVLPDACVELFVNYTSTPIAIIDNELYKGSIITSRMSRPIDVQMRKGAGCLAICFHPGMAYHFFHIPMHVLADNIISLSDSWNGVVVEIEDRLASSHNNIARVALLQKYLLQKLISQKQDLQLEFCLKQIYLSAGLIPISDLTASIGLSQRHLSRKFQQHVGLSPKAYSSVSRFIRSLAHLKKYPNHSLTQIAYESGYFDQSHFNRDYKTYTGYTPSQVVNSRHILY